MRDAGLLRAAALFHGAGLPGPTERLELGESNQVWANTLYVLRIATNPGGDLLLREAALVKRLPQDVGYPRVHASGTDDGYEWIITERLPGGNLGRLWPSLSPTARVAAMTDLLVRLDQVHRTPLHGLPSLLPTPLYALDQAAASAQVGVASEVLRPLELESLQQILAQAVVAIEAEPRVLVHTDAGWHNTVWDGQRAIPVDFEFACLGPADLDLEHIGREAMLGGDAGVAQAFVAHVDRILAVDSSLLARLRSYAVLWDLWALTKWMANDPARSDIETWRPLLDLKAHRARTSWVDQLQSRL